MSIISKIMCFLTSPQYLQAVLSALAILVAVWISTRQSKAQYENNLRLRELEALDKQSEFANKLLAIAKRFDTEMVLCVKAMKQDNGEYHVADHHASKKRAVLVDMQQVMGSIFPKMPENCVRYASRFWRINSRTIYALDVMLRLLSESEKSFLILLQNHPSVVELNKKIEQNNKLMSAINSTLSDIRENRKSH